MNGYSEVKNWHRETALKNLSETLKERDFSVEILNSREEITECVLGIIPVEAAVGIGGSATIRELNLDTLLKQRGNKLYDHWEPGLTKEEVLNARKKQLTSDYFLTSVNAVTADGRIVNIDGVGNRVASMIFGPKRVIAIIGFNKIARNMDEALWRIKNIATPMNAKRLGLKTPCAAKGRCMECKPAASICKVTTIIDARPAQTEFKVILTPLELGF